MRKNNMSIAHSRGALYALNLIRRELGYNFTTSREELHDELNKLTKFFNFIIDEELEAMRKNYEE